uniref:Golgi associated, gamma adaptin ear containing, ARF binding protein 3 n=1 Tax=Hucho hucho TaxID=62062 RepID=A0A4W5KJH7_9TELE
MAYQEGETLESWLNKATHPTNRQEDWEYIIGFCDQINKELEGPQIAVRLLVHKIQSPQEWEALQALTVLEACMKNCGRRFHNEIGKYRFLNELIKVVSPKYMGDRVPEKVKTKIIEMLYSWTVAFPNEAKINEAYQTLRRQGLVTMDPELPVDKTLIPSPPTRPKNPVFDNEDMGKLLAELLRSKNPEDLQEANRLIKNMVKEDDVRVQKVTKRIHTLEEVGINVKLLSEMLSHYDKNRSSQSDREIIKELYDRCDKLRRAAFKMATETEDNDTSLGDILRASDDLSRVINSYKKIVKGQTVNGDSEDPRSATRNSDHPETLIDLAGIDVTNSTSPPPAPLPLVSDPTSANHLGFPIPVLPPPPKRLAGLHASQNNSPSHPATDKALNALSLLDDELLSLGTSLTLHFMEVMCNCILVKYRPYFLFDLYSKCIHEDCVHQCSDKAPWYLISLCQHYVSRESSCCFSVVSSLRVGGGFGMAASMGAIVSPSLGAMVPQVPLSSTSLLPGPMPGSPAVSHTKAQTLSSAPGSPLFSSLSPFHHSSFQGGSPARGLGPEASLGNVHVPLEAIRPSKGLPVTAYDKDGVRVLLNFASDCPPCRPDVLVLVVSMLNTAPLPVQNVVLQAAVPKSMKVKLQPPSGTELPPFNPILPPASITQVMLLANPLKEKVRLRYKLAFTLGNRQCSEVGEVDQFPPPDRWGHL